MAHLAPFGSRVLVELQEGWLTRDKYKHSGLIIPGFVEDVATHAVAKVLDVGKDVEEAGIDDLVLFHRQAIPSAAKWGNDKTFVLFETDLVGKIWEEDK
jgi:co-chaperonin GroES (HSP10)